jgi:organic radical activating enzyme
MKTFPIKIEKADKVDYKFIEWKIHNVCNNDCSFCGLRHKDGSQRWFSLDKYKEYTDKLVEACGDSPFWIQITGGEPTLYPELLELMQYMKLKGALVSLITNGSRTLRWWKELKEAKVLNNLFVTYHSEQTDNYRHIADVINLFHDEPLEVVCLMTHVLNSIDKVFEAQDYIKANTGSIISVKAMMLGNDDIYSKYSPDQLDRLKKSNWMFSDKRNSKLLPPPSQEIHQTLKITYDNNHTISSSPQELMKQQKNRFIGWDCNIGNNSMRIDHDIIYRGVCEIGEKRNLNDLTLGFTTDYIKCTKKDCFCGTDMIATKILPKSMYPEA